MKTKISAQKLTFIRNNKCLSISCLVVLLLIFTNNIAQTTIQCKSTYNWMFGNQAGITFMGSVQPTPSAVSGSAMNMDEGCASISDESGNLLFYSNGVEVWDVNNTILPNGANLAGGGISAQSSIIVPLPQDDSIYYIFTVKDWTTSQNGIGFNYSIVDIRLPGNGTSANPLGDVDINNKNIPIDTNVREQVTAIYHENCEDIWIITHRGSMWYSSDEYLAYLLTSSGLNTTPVISSVGMTYYANNRFGYLKPSHNGQHLCSTLGRGGSGSNFNGTTVELLEFSNSTGIVSNPIVIADSGDIVNAYSSEFSPDNNILYVVGFDGTFINQYDLSSGDEDTIVASKINIATGTATKSSLQLGPDNKIYVSRDGSHYLGVIDDPNSLLNCNYIDQAVNLGSGTAMLGLPTFWKRQYYQIFNETTICQGDSVFIGGAYQNTPGVYNDTTYGGSLCDSCDQIETTTLSFINVDVSVINASPTLTANASNATYQWLDCDNNYAIIIGETSQSFTATSNGNYAVEVTKNNCPDTSACIAVNNVAILENSFVNIPKLFPNPTSGKLNLVLDNTYDEIIIKIRDINGKLISKQNYKSKQNISFEIKEARGVYIIDVSNNEGNSAKLRVIKN